MAGAFHLANFGEVWPAAPKSAALAVEIRTCSNSDRGRPPSPTPNPRPKGRWRAARPRAGGGCSTRRSQLAADGGFDAVQMRDVAAAADVALGTVYRYFSSKERLLLEAMAEQQADLRGVHRRRTRRARTPRRDARRCRCCGARTGRCARYPDVTAAMVRSFGTAQIENADIVRRVTEIMTGDHHQRDPGARTPGRDRAARCGSRASSCRCGSRR